MTNDVAVDVIRDYFQRMNANVRALEHAKAAAEPSHLEALLAFAGRAYRRPLTKAEGDDLLAFYTHTLAISVHPSMHYQVFLEQAQRFGRVVFLIRFERQVNRNEEEDKYALDFLAKKKRECGSSQEQIEKRRSEQSLLECLPQS